jgi:hypothetical protein
MDKERLDLEDLFDRYRKKP